MCMRCKTRVTGRVDKRQGLSPKFSNRSSHLRAHLCPHSSLSPTLYCAPFILISHPPFLLLNPAHLNLHLPLLSNYSCPWPSFSLTVIILSLSPPVLVATSSHPGPPSVLSLVHLCPCPCFLPRLPLSLTYLIPVYISLYLPLSSRADVLVERRWQQSREGGKSRKNMNDAAAAPWMMWALQLIFRFILVWGGETHINYHFVMYHLGH